MPQLNSATLPIQAAVRVNPAQAGGGADQPGTARLSSDPAARRDDDFQAMLARRIDNGPATTPPMPPTPPRQDTSSSPRPQAGTRPKQEGRTADPVRPAGSRPPASGAANGQAATQQSGTDGTASQAAPAEGAGQARTDAAGLDGKAAAATQAGAEPGTTDGAAGTNGMAAPPPGSTEWLAMMLAARGAPPPGTQTAPGGKAPADPAAAAGIAAAPLPGAATAGASAPGAATPATTPDAAPVLPQVMPGATGAVPPAVTAATPGVAGNPTPGVAGNAPPFAAAIASRVAATDNAPLPAGKVSTAAPAGQVADGTAAAAVAAAAVPTTGAQPVTATASAPQIENPGGLAVAGDATEIASQPPAAGTPTPELRAPLPDGMPPASGALPSPVQTAASAQTGATAPAPAPAPALQLQTPFGADGWRDAVGNSLTWIVGRGEHKAELVLTPPNLGRVEVTLSMANDQATVHFVAASPTVRDALDQALPRLREMLADAGVSLGQSSVSADTSSGGRHDGEPGRRGAPAGPALPAFASGTPAMLRSGNGLVDTFA
ncbi:MAG: flagellar hook-length control protein FliK [Betaproteobacteria bacterium]|nr:flagellar hook-length control protein FliK [Betaproteobacteria bacterium]